MNIDLKNYKQETLSLIALILSLYFTFYKLYYMPLETYNKEIKKMIRDYEKNIEQFRKNELNQISIKVDLSTLIFPSPILKNIDDIFLDRGIEIKSISPISDEIHRYKINFISQYFDLLKILFDFEKLNVEINNLDIKPYEEFGANPLKLVSLDITFLKKIEISQKYINTIEKKLKNIEINPFKTFTNNGKNVTSKINLTYLYNLISINISENRALINGKLYSIGDKFPDKYGGESFIIKNLNIDRVELQKRDSSMQYFIGFQ